MRARAQPSLPSPPVCPARPLTPPARLGARARAHPSPTAAARLLVQVSGRPKFLGVRSSRQADSLRRARTRPASAARPERAAASGARAAFRAARSRARTSRGRTAHRPPGSHPGPSAHATAFGVFPADWSRECCPLRFHKWCMGRR